MFRGLFYLIGKAVATVGMLPGNVVCQRRLAMLPRTGLF